jgi:hypothetical protein
MLIVCVALAASIALLAPAHAFEASISGQVNHLVMWADNGKDSEFFIADNDNSSTRFRFTGSQDFERLTAGFTMEMEAERNSSSKLNIAESAFDEKSDDGDFNFNDRKLEAYFKGGFGKFSIGKGDGAANGTSEVDLSGTSVIMYSGVNDTAADFQFVDEDTGLQSGVSVDATRSNFDGLSRNERVRYDTPSFAGFSAATSITNGDAWELAGRYAGEFGGGHKVAAAIGYIDTKDRDTTKRTQLGLSASWLLPFGLNLTAAYGSADFDEAGREDATNYYVKLGYKWGIHAVAVEYGMTEDLDQKDDESDNYGVAYVIKPWKGVELYAAGRVFKLDRTGANFDDISQIMGGTRIKF